MKNLQISLGLSLLLVISACTNNENKHEAAMDLAVAWVDASFECVSLDVECPCSTSHDGPTQSWDPGKAALQHGPMARIRGKPPSVTEIHA